MGRRGRVSNWVEDLSPVKKKVEKREGKLYKNWFGNDDLSSSEASSEGEDDLTRDSEKWDGKVNREERNRKKKKGKKRKSEEDKKTYIIRHHLVSQFEVKQNVMFDLTWTGSIYW